MRRLDCDGRDVADLPGLWSDDDRVIYTPDEAMAMLPAGDRNVMVASDISPTNGELVLVVADWSRDTIENMFHAMDEIRMSDFPVRAMGWGIEAWKGKYCILVETAQPAAPRN